MHRGHKSFIFSALLGFGIGLAVYMFLGPISPTYGIPAFARKYQTSCATCHSDYPELNDFGEAFKKNGFKFPENDESLVKEPPVMLGAKAQKEVFPEAIYPGEIPGTIPIGFRYSGNATFNSKQPPSAGFVPRSDLFTPGAFALFAAGSFGPNISFWVDDDVSDGGSGADGGLGDGYLKVNDIGHYLHLPKDALNVRFGQFELDLPFSQARSINLSDYDIYDQASFAGVQGSTDNPFAFAEAQRGIEIGGYPNDGNFAWSVSLVNGSNADPAMRNSKDVYVRVSQRFNLERDAASRKAVQAAGPTGPRDHTSIRFGGFYYHGRNDLNIDPTAEDFIPDIGTIKEPFYRAGGDFRFKYRNFELYGLGMYGHDTNMIADLNTLTLSSGTPVTFSGGFAQAQYWFYPWLIGIMRYDAVNSPTDFLNGVSRYNTRNRMGPGLQILLRANIKVAFEYQHGWEQPIPDEPGYFRTNTFATGIDYSF